MAKGKRGKSNRVGQKLSRDARRLRSTQSGIFYSGDLARTLIDKHFREAVDSIELFAIDQRGMFDNENSMEVDRTRAFGALVKQILILAFDPQGIKFTKKAVCSGGPYAVDSMEICLSEPT
ncbi:hypothetical protein RSOLAG22IIIB_12395 [Rhizoctonia solani]|uniref:Uncharacterized protein n=1 Tax=Rhizoctonia solani TaxID=456999 RepID=A0A0K6GDQ3_9AGAM|nr:hypothetical protein RSOLAG22IIIB_12395 [Rhizoctonia solani]